VASHFQEREKRETQLSNICSLKMLLFVIFYIKTGMLSFRGYLTILLNKLSNLTSQ